MDEILKIPFAAFNKNWDDLQLFLKHKGNPPYEITDDLYLSYSKIESLGNLTSVGGNLDLYNCTNLTSLGNLTSVGGHLGLSYSNVKSLGNLTSVGGELDLSFCEIESLGNLTSVGGDLNLRKTPLSREYSEEKIRSIVKVKGSIYF